MDNSKGMDGNIIALLLRHESMIGIIYKILKKAERDFRWKKKEKVEWDEKWIK